MSVHFSRHIFVVKLTIMIILIKNIRHSLYTFVILPHCREMVARLQRLIKTRPGRKRLLLSGNCKHWSYIYQYSGWITVCILRCY